MTLALFDIDGTLIQSGRAGVRGMNAAFGRLYGRSSALDGVPVAGRTDRAIVMQAMKGVDIDPTDPEIIRLRDAYFELLGVELGRSVAEPCGVLPGVVELIERLQADPSVTVGLLTGNFHGGAKIKLSHFDLWHRFAFGAFGDHHTNRRDLVPVALEEAKRAGLSLRGPEDIVVIGDTPLDVDCATAHGARCLAVATGLYSVQQLVDAGAHRTVETLSDTETLAGWI